MRDNCTCGYLMKKVSTICTYKWDSLALSQKSSRIPFALSLALPAFVPTRLRCGAESGGMRNERETNEGRMREEREIMRENVRQMRDECGVNAGGTRTRDE